VFNLVQFATRKQAIKFASIFESKEIIATANMYRTDKNLREGIAA
jgi:hypothetical protein